MTMHTSDEHRPETPMSVSAPQDRRQMLDILQGRIGGTQTDLEEEQRLGYGNNQVKTQIVETNITAEELISGSDTIIGADKIDADLYSLKATAVGDEGYFFLDTSNSRFWILYSLKDSKFVNSAVSAIISGEGVGLDKPWIPGHQIENIMSLGTFQGVRLTYDADQVFPGEFIDEELKFSDLSMNTTGRGASDLYNLLDRSEDIEDYLAVYSVNIDRQVNGDLIRERIRSDGSFTTKGGTSVQLHVDTVNQVRHNYQELLTRIEEEHLIKSGASDIGGAAQGSPVVVHFSHPVQDIETFLESIINARDPFRLWGHIEQLGDQYYAVDAVDMHNGDSLDIEMANDWMRIYLYDGACGNTALRIFSNLQRHYDPAAQLDIQ